MGWKKWNGKHHKNKSNKITESFRQIMSAENATVSMEEEFEEAELDKMTVNSQSLEALETELDKMTEESQSLESDAKTDDDIVISAANTMTESAVEEILEGVSAVMEKDQYDILSDGNADAGCLEEETAKITEPIDDSAGGETAENREPADDTAGGEPAETVEIAVTENEDAVENTEHADNPAGEEKTAENIEPVEEFAGAKKEEKAETAAISEEGTEAEAVEIPLNILEPADVFGFFRQIAAIPHGSFNTEKISDYLENFAKERALEYIRDEYGNLIITKPAAPGCEDADPIALQGHIDMVCEKEIDVDIDMDTEPIILKTDGKWLSAEGTTLGGDDGIAVAIMLALLDDKNLKAPMLECIFTVDEEVGLLGASGIDLSSLKSRKLINMDSEEEGVITASCGGGADVGCTLHGERRYKNGIVASLSVGGLTGGHSGDKIGEGRGNAVLILARLLYRLSKEGKFYIVSLDGGKRDNAIPRNATAEILFKGKKKRKKFQAAIKAFTTEVRNEFSMTDPNIQITATITEKGKKETRRIFTHLDSMRIVRFLMVIPNGVIEFMPGFREIPRTSLSLGIAATLEDGFCTNSLVRSNINSRKQMIINRLICLAEAFEASVEISGSYPAWELVVESDFRRMAKQVYEKVTGRKAVVTMIHAGLECGILSSKVPGLECISIGPDIEDIHTPAERLNVESTARIYNYVRALLGECAEKSMPEET